MAFMDKIGSLLKRPNEDIVPKDEVPWWLKYSGRGLGAVGGGVAIFLGIWNCVSILFADVSCLVSGLLQMIAGFLVICVEAPCCCMFIEFVQTFSDWVDKRPYWNRAVFYGGIAIPPVIFCPSLGSFFGCGLILVTGVLYGMMALGRKATVEEMAAAAAMEQAKARNNLVTSAVPIGQTLPPV